MAKAHPKKELARMMYVEHGIDAKAISEMLDISENTISKWVNSYENWKQQRQVRMLSPDKLISHFYEQSEEIIKQSKDEKRPINSGEADALNKLASAIQKLDKKIDPSISMSVFRNYNNYLMQIDPLLAKQNAEHQLMYIQQLMNESK